jgi:hypothetical protein
MDKPIKFLILVSAGISTICGMIVGIVNVSEKGVTFLKVVINLIYQIGRLEFYAGLCAIVFLIIYSIFSGSKFENESANIASVSGLLTGFIFGINLIINKHVLAFENHSFRIFAHLFGIMTIIVLLYGSYVNYSERK